MKENAVNVEFAAFFIAWLEAISFVCSICKLCVGDNCIRLIDSNDSIIAMLQPSMASRITGVSLGAVGLLFWWQAETNRTQEIVINKAVAFLVNKFIFYPPFYHMGIIAM